MTYAGPGRTPFGGDSPPATAGRILTQEPDLSGLAGPLRDLVAYALQKDPADRPTARELLDLLVAAPSRPAASAAALAGQPDLRAAASQAQSVTGLMPAPPEPAPTGLVGYHEESIVTVPISAIPALEDAPDDEPEQRRWFLPVAVAFVVLAVIAGAMMVVFGPPPDDGTAAVNPPAVTATSSAPAPLPTTMLLADDLTHARLWLAKREPDGLSTCSFTDGTLVAEVAERRLYKCPGPQDDLPVDLHAEVGVRLLTADSCAAIWFRFRLPRGGYQVRVCASNVFVGTHKSTTVAVTRTLPLDQPIAVGGPAVRIGLVIDNGQVTVTRDGTALGSVPLDDAELTGRRLVLGVYPDRGAPDEGPFKVAFDHIVIRGPGER